MSMTRIIMNSIAVQPTKEEGKEIGDTVQNTRLALIKTDAGRPDSYYQDTVFKRGKALKIV